MARQTPVKADGLIVWQGKRVNDIWSFGSSLATAEVKWANSTAGPKFVVTADFSKIELHVPSKTEKVDLLKLDVVPNVTICDPVTGATQKVDLVIQRKG